MDEQRKNQYAAAIEADNERYHTYTEFARQGAALVASMDPKPDKWYFSVRLGDTRPSMDNPLVRDACGYDREGNTIIISIPYRPGHMTACKTAWYLQYLHGDITLDAPLPSYVPPIDGIDLTRTSHYVQAIWDGQAQRTGWYDREEMDNFHGVSDSSVSNAAEEDKSKASGPDFAGWLDDMRNAFF